MKEKANFRCLKSIFIQSLIELKFVSDGFGNKFKTLIFYDQNLLKQIINYIH